MHEGGDAGHGRVRHPAETRLRGLDEHELMHCVFEHVVSAGVRLAECQRDRTRPVGRFDENVFDLPAVARRMGWDEHEFTHRCSSLWRRRACGRWRSCLRLMPVRWSSRAEWCRSRGRV